jgi:chemotaxis protein CheC
MKLNPEQLDILKELINIGVGRAAGVLSEMVSSRISLQVPYINMLSPSELKQKMEQLGNYRISAVRLGFKGPFSGSAALVFPPDSASKLVSVLTNEESGSLDLDSVRIGTLSEIGNIVLNGVMGSIANVLKQRINYSLPNYFEDNIIDFLMTPKPDPDAIILMAHTRFIIEHLHIEGDIFLIFEVGSLDSLLSGINTDSEVRY